MDLDYKARVALILLAGAGGTMVQADLRTKRGLVLSTKQFGALKAGKLVVTTKHGRSNVLALTPAGWDFIEAEHTRPLPPRSGDGARAVQALLDGLSIQGMSLRQTLEREFVAPPPPPKKPRAPRKPKSPPLPVEDRIRDAYRRLAKADRDWVELTDMRAALPDVPRADFDAAIAAMRRARDVTLTLHENQSRLTKAQRDAAIRLGPDDMHLMSMN